MLFAEMDKYFCWKTEEVAQAFFFFFLATTYFHEKNVFLKNLVNNPKTVDITLLSLCYIYAIHNRSAHPFVALIYVEHGDRLIESQ